MKGKVICGNCGSKLQRKHGAGNADWYFFICISKNRIGAEHCSGMYVREAAVIDAIRGELFNCIKSWAATTDNRRKEQLRFRQQIDRLERNLDAQNKERRKIYEDMVVGKLTSSEYSDLKAMLPDLKTELLEKRQQLKQLEMDMKMRQAFCDAEVGKSDLKDVIDCYLSTVTVYNDKRIKVKFCS